MDCLLVDITKTDAKLNDEVIIMDIAQNSAKWEKTSPYEIL